MNSFLSHPVNKYRNKKVIIDGILFDSQKEAKVYVELKQGIEAGEIKDLKLQHQYELIPTQRDPDTKKVIERPCTYTADFVVTYPDGEVVVIDCKGARGLDQKYPIKRKLMLWRYGLKIKEV